MKTRTTAVSVIAATALFAAMWAGAETLHVDAGHSQAADTNPGTPEKPLKTISHAAELVKPGDRVLIHTGTYREEVHIKASGTADRPIVFEPAPFARVEMTGADVLDGLKKEPGNANLYSAPWSHRFITWSRTGTHPGDAYHVLIGRAEQVIVGNYLLRQVLERSQLARGTFWVDLEGNRIYLWDAADRKLADDWAAPPAEAATREAIWVVEGSYIQTRGLLFRYAANHAQAGAVNIKGSNNVLEDCVAEDMNGAGAHFSGNDHVVRRCIFRNNGQQGYRAENAHRLLMSDCIIENNNTKNFDRGGEAGGMKVVFSRGMVLERCQFLRNRGNGVWFDIGNEDCVVRNCLIADNEDAGLFYEISYGLHAHDNVIVGNGFFRTPGTWGANGGVSISSSPNCVVERNLLLGNREGFQFREQPRTTLRIGQTWGDKPETTIWNHDTIIRNNLIAYNRDNQIGGWFDTDIMPHWPKAMQEEARKANSGKAPADIAAAYQAAAATGRSPDLTLEGLNFRFESNWIATTDRQRICLWGAPWRFSRTWETLAQASSALPIFHDDAQGPVKFADPVRLDLRIPADSPAAMLKAYPQGEVPGVVLGTTP